MWLWQAAAAQQRCCCSCCRAAARLRFAALVRALTQQLHKAAAVGMLSPVSFLPSMLLLLQWMLTAGTPASCC
jgi:hypothetical protein